MRTIFVLLIGMLVGFQSPASEVDAPHYGRRKTITNLNVHMSQVERVETDLLYGMWTVSGDYGTNQVTAETMFQFNESGLVDIYSTNIFEETTYASNMWTVHQFGSSVFLIMENLGNDLEKLYKVTQHCEGITLEDATNGELIFFEYTPRKHNSSFDLMSRQLTGIWKNNFYPYDIAQSFDHCGTFEKMNGAYLVYEFMEDGRFVRKIGSDMIDIVETGYYEISMDGKFVTLQFMVENNPDLLYATSVLKIERISDGRLAIQQTIETIDFQDFFCTAMKTFTFEKSSYVSR